MCKFTPLGFETYTKIYHGQREKIRVNLPRWGLKPDAELNERAKELSVNLPRWGLKLIPKVSNDVVARSGVNLPRWGLKLA